MERPTAKKLKLTKETLRTLSNADLRAVIGGTDAAASEEVSNCVEIDPATSNTCLDSADGCLIEWNLNVHVDVNTLRRF